MVNLAFPKAASSLSIGQVLGNLHSDQYYAPANPQYWPKIAGVASMWGGINIPKSKDNDEAGFFALGDVSLIPPLIAFHGANDTTIPFYDRLTDQDIDLSAPPTQPGENYNSESLCTLGNDCPNNIINGNTFSQKSGSGIELKICSSLNLYRVMKDPSVNRFAELYVDCSAKHGLDADCPLCINAGNTNPDKNGNCMPCTPYSSDYGTGAANVADTIIYMAGRIAVHSHAVMKGNATGTPLTFGIVGRSYFKDCVNNRKCNQATTQTNCVDPAPNSETLCDNTPLFPTN